MGQHGLQPVFPPCVLVPARRHTWNPAPPNPELQCFGSHGGAKQPRRSRATSVAQSPPACGCLPGPADVILRFSELFAELCRQMCVGAIWSVSQQHNAQGALAATAFEQPDSGRLRPSRQQLVPCAMLRRSSRSGPGLRLDLVAASSLAGTGPKDGEGDESKSTCQRCWAGQARVAARSLAVF